MRVFKQFFLFYCISVFLSMQPFPFKTMCDFKIGTLNINGARDCFKRASLYQLFKDKRLDILFIQETHSTLDNERDWKKEWSGDVFLSHKSFNSGGVGILFSNNFKPVSYNEEVVVEGRLLKVKTQYEDVKMVFINIYAPTKGTERLLFLDTLGEVISQCDSDEYLFLGGDFNCTEDSRLDSNHLEPHPVSLRRLTSNGVL